MAAIANHVWTSVVVPWFTFVLFGTNASAQGTTARQTARNSAIEAFMSPDGSFGPRRGIRHSGLLG